MFSMVVPAYSKRYGVDPEEMRTVLARIASKYVGIAADKREDSKCASLAFVVGTENDKDIFDGDDESEGPDDQR